MDEVAAWQEAQQRVCDLVEGVDPERMERKVPATPDWTGRDLLSHMVGLGADVLAGDEPDDHNPDWTQAQVDARRDRSAAELVEEWRGLADDLVAWMRENGARPLGDVVIHEQDLRGCLEESGARDTAEFGLVRDRMAKRFASSLDEPSALALVGEQWSLGDPDSADVVVQASDFDLGRALMSRRTADQLRSWTVRGDLTPYLKSFEVLGPLADEDLTD